MSWLTKKKDVFDIYDGLPAYTGRWSDDGHFAKLHRHVAIDNNCIQMYTKNPLSSILVTSLFASFGTFYHLEFLFKIPVEFNISIIV